MYCSLVSSIHSFKEYLLSTTSVPIIEVIIAAVVNEFCGFKQLKLIFCSKVQNWFMV